MFMSARDRRLTKHKTSERTDSYLNEPMQWALPTPLRPDGTTLLPFPVNALPPILREMASAIATTTSTDVAMAGTSILSAVSYCFVNNRKNDKRANPVENRAELCKGEIFYITCIDEKSKLKPVWEKYKNKYNCFLQTNFYTKL